MSAPRTVERAIKLISERKFAQGAGALRGVWFNVRVEKIRAKLKAAIQAANVRDQELALTAAREALAMLDGTASLTIPEANRNPTANPVKQPPA